MESNHEELPTASLPVSSKRGGLFLGLVLGAVAATVVLLGILLIFSENQTANSADGTRRSSGFSLMRQHRAQVWLRVAKTLPKVMYDAPLKPHYLNDREAQPILIRSSIVLNAALQQPGIAELDSLKNEKDKKQWLIDHLEVGFLGETEILQIAIKGENPEDLIKILHAVRAAYMEQVVAAERDLEVRRRMTLENAYKNTEMLISRKMILVKNLEDQLTTPDSQTTRCWSIFPLLTVDTLQNRVDTLVEEIFALNKQIAILKGRLSLLTEEKETEKEKSSDEPLPFPIDAKKLQAEIEIMTSDRDAHQMILDTTMKSYKQVVAAAEQSNKGSWELDNAREELDRLKTAYREMGKELDKWTLEAQAPPRVQPITEPEVSKTRR